jgi:hypothetical protein
MACPFESIEPIGEPALVVRELIDPAAHGAKPAPAL